jgi:hypothetical protein
MGADKGEPVAIANCPVILLCQHLGPTRRTQHSVHHSMLDSISAEEYLRGRRARSKSRPAGYP